MSQRLIYVMDPLCSWCWGFAPVIDAIRESAPQLAIHLVVGGLRSERDPLTDKARSVLAEHWEAVKEVSGQPFADPAALPERFVYDTEPACRALIVGRELDVEKVWMLTKIIQYQFYAGGVDVSQTSVLVDLAEQAGYQRQSFSDAYDAEITRAAIAADFSWTRDLGIAGFPTLLAQRNGQLALLTNGYQSAKVVLPLLERWLAAGQGISTV